MTVLEKRDLGLDELEAMRLADMLGLPQTEAARRMNISQSTFNRILASARQKAAECVVTGLAMRIVSDELSNSAIGMRGASVAGGARGHCRRRRGR